jgi:hypothetical protein
MTLALGVLLTAEYPVSELVALARLSKALEYDEVASTAVLNPAIPMALPGTE